MTFNPVNIFIIKLPKNQLSQGLLSVTYFLGS